MHNRTLVVWFGMVVSASLLGCPPAAKSAKDAPAATEGSAAGAEPQSGEAKDSKAEEKKEAAPPPAPSGGW